MEDVEDIAPGSRDAQLGARLSGFAEAVSHDADAGAIDMGHGGEIEDHHFGSGLDGSHDFGLDIAAIATERDAAAEFQYRDAIFEFALFNLDQHLRCIQDTASADQIRHPSQTYA